MSLTPQFGTQLIGQTEKARNAILDRQLAGTGLTETQWVTLTLAVMSGATIDRASYIRRLAGALKMTQAEALLPQGTSWAPCSTAPTQSWPVQVLDPSSDPIYS
jgi:hypothetical protein